VNTHSILDKLGLAVIALAVPVLGLFVGGFSITAKTGSAPKGILWTEIPAVGGGVVGICSLAIMASMVATVQMPKGAKVWIGFLGTLGLAATAINLPFYMIAAANESTIPEAIKWAFGEEIKIGLWTYINYMLWFVSIDTGLAGVITARMYSESEQRISTENPTEILPGSTRRRVVGKIDEQVLALIKASDQTVNMIHEDLPEYQRHHVQAAVNRLVEKNEVTKEKRGGREYWYTAIPEMGK
jgi:hypothetical protein